MPNPSESKIMNQLLKTIGIDIYNTITYARKNGLSLKDIEDKISLSKNSLIKNLFQENSHINDKYSNFYNNKTVPNISFNNIQDYLFDYMTKIPQNINILSPDGPLEDLPSILELITQKKYSNRIFKNSNIEPDESKIYTNYFFDDIEQDNTNQDVVVYIKGSNNPISHHSILHNGEPLNFDEAKKFLKPHLEISGDFQFHKDLPTLDDNVIETVEIYTIMKLDY